MRSLTKIYIEKGDYDYIVVYFSVCEITTVKQQGVLFFFMMVEEAEKIVTALKVILPNFQGKGFQFVEK